MYNQRWWPNYQLCLAFTFVFLAHLFVSLMKDISSLSSWYQAQQLQEEKGMWSNHCHCLLCVGWAVCQVLLQLGAESVAFPQGGQGVSGFSGSLLVLLIQHLFPHFLLLMWTQFKFVECFSQNRLAKIKFFARITCTCLTLDKKGLCLTTDTQGPRLIHVSHPLTAPTESHGIKLTVFNCPYFALT